MSLADLRFSFLFSIYSLVVFGLDYLSWLTVLFEWALGVVVLLLLLLLL